MATPFNMTRDINGFNGYGLKFSDTKSSVTLASATDTSLTVPGAMAMGGNGISTTSQWLAVFSYQPGANIYVALNQTAASPSGASFADTTSDHLPAARLVNGGDVLHFFTNDTSADVTVLFYSI